MEKERFYSILFFLAEIFEKYSTSTTFRRSCLPKSATRKFHKHLTRLSLKTLSTKQQDVENGLLQQKLWQSLSTKLLSKIIQGLRSFSRH